MPEFDPSRIRKHRTSGYTVTRYGPAYAARADGTIQVTFACNEPHPKTGEACRWEKGHDLMGGEHSWAVPPGVFWLR